MHVPLQKRSDTSTYSTNTRIRKRKTNTNMKYALTVSYLMITIIMIVSRPPLSSPYDEQDIKYYQKNN